MLDTERALGNTLVAGFAAARQVQDARRVQGARNAAAISRATTAVNAATADELRRDLVLAQMDVASLREEIVEVAYEVAQERKRTELLMSLLMEAKDPSLTLEARKVAIAAALAAVRKQVIA